MLSVTIVFHAMSCTHWSVSAALPFQCWLAHLERWLQHGKAILTVHGMLEAGEAGDACTTRFTATDLVNTFECMDSLARVVAYKRVAFSRPWSCMVYRVDRSTYGVLPHVELGACAAMVERL